MVFTSGAGTSVFGPMYLAIFWIYPLLNLSNSPTDNVLGSTMTPHFPPPRGIPTTDVLSVIQADKDITSSLETCW